MHYPSRDPTKVFDDLITEKKVEYAVSLYDDYFDVPKQLIYQRIKRQKPLGYCKGAMSSTRHLEEALVDVLRTVANMNTPLSSGEGIKLANKLIKNMKLEEYIIAYKCKMRMHCGEDGRNKDGTILGLGWWQRFMKRSRHKPMSAKGRSFSCNSEDWCTYDNFLNMYKCIYKEMVGTGVAKKLDVPVFMDADENEVDAEKAYGQTFTHKLVHPELCFLFDETGDNTCR